MRTPFVLLAILLCAAFAPLSLAKEGDDDDAKPDDQGGGRSGRGSDDGFSEQRKVRVLVEGARAEIKLERATEGAEDEVKVVLDAAEASMKVEYETKNATERTETGLKVRLREVVEYADSDGDGAFDPGSDRVVARYDATSLRWSVSHPTPVSNGAGKVGQRIVGTGLLPGNGSVSFVMSVYGDFATVNGTSLRPSDVKIDILQDDFPYRENGTATALLFRTERESKAQLRNDGDDERLRGVQAVANGFAAYFTWAGVASVDGVERPVLTTPVANSTGGGGSKLKDSFWLSYPRGQHVNHDPVLGVASAEAATVQTRNDSPGPGAFVAVAAVATAAVLAAFRRRGA